MSDDKPALIVQMNADLSKFEGAMKQAGDIADKAVSGLEGRFQSAFGGSFFGNLFANFATKGIESAVKLVSDLVDRFVDLDKVSRLVGVSMQELFGLQTAASKFQVPIEDATASLKNLAVLLNQTQRGEQNSLSALFDANPQALKGINRDALTLQQTLAVVANIVANGFNPLDKIDLAKAAGQAETMVPFLERGGKAVTELSAAAAKSAPDLQKLADSAKEFDAAWRSAVTNVKAYLSEHFLDFIKQDLTDIVALLGVAQKFLGLFQGGPIEAQTAQAAETLKELQQTISSIGTRKDDQSIARVPVTGGTTDRSGFSRVPTKPQAAEPNDAFDRAEESILKRTAAIQADTIAVSQNNAVQAQLRAEFELLNGIRKADGEVTQDQVDAYVKLRDTMTAQQALVAAGINLTKEHSEAFFRDSQNIGQATAQFDKARDSVSKLNSASSQIGSALSTAFADAVVEGKNLNEVFTSLLKTLEKAAINSLFASFFNAPATGGLSGFASLFGLGSIGKNAGGTDYWSGGPTWVGEKGPEIVNLPRGAQVVPNAVATRSSGGVFAPVYQIDAAGADAGTVLRIQQVLQQHARTMQQIIKQGASSSRFAQTGVG